MHVCVQHLNDRRIHATPDIQMLDLSEAQRLWLEAMRWRVKGLVFAGRGGYDNIDPLKGIFFPLNKYSLKAHMPTEQQSLFFLIISIFRIRHEKGCLEKAVFREAQDLH